MVEEIVLGIDAGTTGTKVLAVTRSGEILAKSYQGYPMCFPQEDQAEQDLELVWDAVLFTLRSVCKQLSEQERKRVRALSISTQRSTMTLTDEKGNPLRHAITWMDGRASKECEELEQAMGAETVHQITGVAISTIWTMSYLLWLKKHEPDLFRKASCFSLVHSFLMKRLGAPDLCVDYSNACETMLLDPSSRRWSSSMLEYLGIREERLPRLVESGVPLGVLSKDLAFEMGLSDHVLLVSGGGDQQCAALGASVVQAGEVAVGMGTAANVLIAADRRVSAGENLMMENLSVIPGKWFLEGSLIACGPILDWVKQKFYPGQSGYAELDREAELSPPGANGVRMLPHFQGAGCPYWDSASRGAFAGITLSTSRGDMARAVMEGLAAEIAKSLKLGYASCGPWKKIVVTGGAARSPVWCSILADVFGASVEAAAVADVAAVGAAAIAAAGAGLYLSIGEAAHAMSRPGTQYTCHEGTRSLYESLVIESDTLYWKLYGQRQRKGIVL